MRKSLLTVAASMLGLALVLSPIANVQAAELQILAGGAMTGPLRELAAQFESASGHKLVFRFGTTPELIKLSTTGGPFDLGVVPRDVLKDAAARAQFASGPTTDIARVGLGVAVRSGALKPDISTPDALKQTLLKAQSIATIPASATGTQVLRVFEVLGIGEAMKLKTKAQPTPAQVVQTVANGEIELAVFLMNVLTAPGLDVVGPFPAELQQEVVFTAAVAGGWLCCLPVLFTVACTIPPESGSSAPRPAHVLPADARALAYGRTAGEVIQNPELRDKVRALFGADWTPASQGRGQLASGAVAYFEKGGPLRMVQIAGSDYIAVTGCVPSACQTLRVLLLIREGGSQILARLDDGGFSHYYAYGSGSNQAAAAPPIVDSGLRALESVGDPYPSAGS